MNQDERDERSVKCPDCGGHIMLSNSISYDNAADDQYRPIYGEQAKITIKGLCISNPSHKHTFEGSLILQSSEVNPA